MYLAWIIQTVSSMKVFITLVASLVAIKSESRVDTKQCGKGCTVDQKYTNPECLINVDPQQ
jgi:hypothetical protein